MTTGSAIALAVVALVVAFPVVVYNRFVRVRQHLRESWSGIDVELRRRYDLIPNLVETVKGYAAHERAVLEAVATARARAAANHGDHRSQIRDEERFVAEVRRLLAIAEAYPDLKADQHFLALQRELAETENRLAAARRLHNANVRDWNTLGDLLPWSLFRSLVSWAAEPYFEVEPALRSAPPVIPEGTA